MLDDETALDPKQHADSDHFDQAMLYDFAKFLTTLALLALGGVLTLSQTADEQITSPTVVGFVAGSIALAGIFAITAAAKLAKVNLSKRKSRITAQQYLTTAVFLLGLGAGGFLQMWWKTL